MNSPGFGAARVQNHGNAGNAKGSVGFGGDLDLRPPDPLGSPEKIRKVAGQIRKVAEVLSKVENFTLFLCKITET